MHRDVLLSRLGGELRALRERQALTRAEVCRSAGLSTRFLADLEHGTGNISVARLELLATALGTRASALLAAAEREQAEPSVRLVISLLGLRGAGKSTIGAALAASLGLPFIELDQRIEGSVGLSLGQIFELHGEQYFRRVERETLSTLLLEQRPLVVATGGGIVTDEQTFDLLRRRTKTVWLKAQAHDHWARVVSQGDRRPMANRARAMDELRGLLLTRAPLYSLSDFVIDTSRLDVAASVSRIVSRLTI